MTNTSSIFIWFPPAPCGCRMYSRLFPWLTNCTASISVYIRTALATVIVPLAGPYDSPTFHNLISHFRCTSLKSDRSTLIPFDNRYFTPTDSCNCDVYLWFNMVAPPVFICFSRLTQQIPSVLIRRLLCWIPFVSCCHLLCAPVHPAGVLKFAVSTRRCFRRNSQRLVRRLLYSDEILLYHLSYCPRLLVMSSLTYAYVPSL